MSTTSFPKLQFFPVTLFASVMGMAGLALAWQKTQQVAGVDYGFNKGLALAVAALFCAVLFAYFLKALRHWGAVKKELDHPVALSFFPAISISLILIGTMFVPLWPQIAYPIWVVGVVLQFVLVLFVVSSWVDKEHFEIVHMNPSWFIPAVGNVIVPIAGIGFGHVEVSWLFFSVGIMFWSVLLTIAFNRILFHNPLPPALLPTLAILIAPPAIGFVAYLKLAGGLDNFGRFLYFCGLFFAVFVALQAPRFARLPFFLSWWAYSFPVAAIAIASWEMFRVTGIAGYSYLAWGFVALLTLIVAGLTIATLKAAANDKICVPPQ